MTKSAKRVGIKRFRRPRSAPVAETVRLTGIKQGAGKSVRVAFGTSGARKTKKHHMKGTRANKVWDAFDPAHMPLPRAVAPYTVIRTTAIWDPKPFSAGDLNRQLAIFGPVLADYTAAPQQEWSNVFCLSSNGGLASPLGGTGQNDACKRWTFPSLAQNNGAWSGAVLVPAAFSVQIMNPAALQEADGMCYIGRCRQKVSLPARDLSSTWQQLANDLVGYSEPRLCSGGKLALRGVQCDGLPSDMSAAASFTSLRRVNDVVFDITADSESRFDGFLPIFIYNPKSIPLQVLVCCEWRVRFDPSNPAYASHKLHKPASEETWFSCMERGVAMGAGVIDIADKVATYGRALM